MTKIAFNPNVNGTGTFTIAAPNSNTDRTFTLPDASGTVLTSAGGTITNPLTVNLNSGQVIFETQDANNYARFTQSSGSAQLGLFRTGAPSGGMYIGGDGDQFSVWSSSFVRQLNVSQSGRVTMPNQPAFAARYNGVSTSIGGSNGNGTMIYGNAQINIGNHYNPSTGIFTAPITGLYWFHWTGIKSDSTGNMDSFVSRLDLTHTGTGVPVQLRLDSGQPYDIAGISAIIRLNTNDTARITKSDNGGVHQGWATFSGFLIG